jgi:NAD dependent epimerase/dehydratase
MILINKNILVTGADGFIGSHLTELLVKKCANVKALALYNSFNNWGWLEDVDCRKDIDIITGDIRDSHFCNKITQNIDIVFHLAALIAIPYSYISPESYFDTNVRGTLNICQAALHAGCEKVIHTSTSEVYGSALYVPIDEKHPTQAQSPYSASKIGADALAMSFFNSFDLPLLIARPFNTYGPRQSARAIIPSVISQIAAGENEIKAGDLTPTRDFNYVDDTCRGFVALAECDQAIGEVVNIGSNYEISIGEIFRLIKKIMKSDVNYIMDKARIRPANSEVHRLWCDNTKINRLTGFLPQIGIEEGLSKTIDWMCRPDNLIKYKPGIYNV